MAGIPFELNVIYNVDDVARILDMHPQTVRALCKNGRIPSAVARGGYRVTGWQIRDYCEGRCNLKNQH